MSMNEIYKQLSKYVNGETDKILILYIENRNITGLASELFGNADKSLLHSLQKQANTFA